MKLKNYSKTVIGLVRKANEDSIGSLTNIQSYNNSDVFVVCDGMGGHVGGATASQTAVSCILSYFKGSPHPNPIIALEKAISLANSEIYSISTNNSELKGMGTTCVVLLNLDNSIYIAHVGDSRIYINTDNKIYRLTKDHSFVQKLVDAGQLADHEMETHPRKNELTKALGISKNVVVEVSQEPIFAKAGDKFLLCSDGLCGLVNDMTILNTLNNKSGHDAVDELIQLAENAGGNDNISADLVCVIESNYDKSTFVDKGNPKFLAEETQIITANDLNSKNNFFDKIFKNYKLIIPIFLLILIITSLIIYKCMDCKSGIVPQEDIPNPELIDTNTVNQTPLIKIDSKNNDKITDPEIDKGASDQDVGTYEGMFGSPEEDADKTYNDKTGQKNKRIKKQKEKDKKGEKKRRDADKNDDSSQLNERIKKEEEVVKKVEEKRRDNPNKVKANDSKQSKD